MATLNDYKGSVGLVAGLKPISTGYPLMEAHDIQVGVGDVRLDTKLASLDSSTGSSSDVPNVNGTTTWSRIKAIENRLGLSTDSSNRSGDTAWSRINKLRDDIEHIRTQVIGSSYFPSQSNPYTDNYNVDNKDRIATRLSEHDANFAEEYDATNTYNKGDYVIYKSALYRCKTNNTSTWNASKWDRVNLSDAMEDVVANVSDILDSNIGKSTDAANATGTTAWSRINAIQSNLGKSTDSYTVVGGSNTADSNTTVWTRIKALERGLGSISDLDKPATVIGTSVWSVAQYAQNMASTALDALGITYTLNTSGGQYTGGATVSVSTVLGKSTDAANASGTSAWSRINAIQPSLGTSSDAANAAGTSAWSRIKALESGLGTTDSAASLSGTNAWGRIKNLENAIGLSETPSASSVNTKITALQSAVGQPSDAANSGNLAALYPRIKAIEAELGKMSNTAIRNVWDSNSTIWGLLKGLQNDFNALLSYLSITRTSGQSISNSGLITDIQDAVDEIEGLIDSIGSSTDTANLNGSSLWSIINKLKSIAGGSGYSVLTLSSGTTATNIASFLSGMNKSNLIILNGSAPSSSDAITALYNAGLISSNSSSSVSNAVNKWYYYDTSTSKWVSGGSLSASTTIDTTFTQSGKAADAKATGDAIRFAEYESKLIGYKNYYSRPIKYYHSDTDSFSNSELIITRNKEYFEITTLDGNGNVGTNTANYGKAFAGDSNDLINQIFENGKIYEIKVDAISGYAELATSGSSTNYALLVQLNARQWGSTEGTYSYFSSGNNNVEVDVSVNNGVLNLPYANYSTGSSKNFARFKMQNVNYSAAFSNKTATVGYELELYFGLSKKLKMDHVVLKIVIVEYDSGPLPKFKDLIEQRFLCKNLIGNNPSIYYPVEIERFDTLTFTRSHSLSSASSYSVSLYNSSKTLIETISLADLQSNESFTYLYTNKDYIAKYAKVSQAFAYPVQMEYGTRSTAYEAYFAPKEPTVQYVDNEIESPLSFNDSSNDGHIVISYKQWVDPALEGEIPIFSDPNNDGCVVIS